MGLATRDAAGGVLKFKLYVTVQIVELKKIYFMSSLDSVASCSTLQLVELILGCSKSEYANIHEFDPGQ